MKKYKKFNRTIWTDEASINASWLRHIEDYLEGLGGEEQSCQHLRLDKAEHTAETEHYYWYQWECSEKDCSYKMNTRVKK